MVGPEGGKFLKSEPSQAKKFWGNDRSVTPSFPIAFGDMNDFPFLLKVYLTSSR